MTAICYDCGAEKELPLSRCAACGLSPTGDQRAVSIIASTRVLTEPELSEVQRRIRSGEPFRPSRARIDAARGILAGQANVEPVSLSRQQAVMLLAANVLLTPALGYAAWFALRRRPGLGATQALWLTVPVTVVLTVAWVLTVGRSFVPEAVP